jgi:hypothetical protein
MLACFGMAGVTLPPLAGLYRRTSFSGRATWQTFSGTRAEWPLLPVVSGRDRRRNKIKSRQPDESCMDIPLLKMTFDDRFIRLFFEKFGMCHTIHLFWYIPTSKAKGSVVSSPYID